MNDIEQKKAAKEFVQRWQDRGYEKGESQKFWIDLLSNVLGIKNATEFIKFEDVVHIDKATGFIDGFIDKTKVLIEQKSIDKDLRKAIKQSDGSLLNPFQQAKRYSAELPYDNRPRWIVTCNFKSMLVYDMNNPNGEPEEILLKDLEKEYSRLSFLVNEKSEHLKKEEELSFKAGELVGKLYDAFSKEYIDITNEQSQKDLNELCVRLVFCLYAEDAGLFGRKNVFYDYLSKYEDLTLMRENLIKLFKILDTKEEERDPYLEDDLNQFPYVNGGLFSNENIEIPKFTSEIRNTLLAKASDEFDWSEISPTIFGAVFESTLNPETRRAGGMHYTSIENIHKVIDPLFLNDLRERLNKAEGYKNEKTRKEELLKFQEYLGSLKFLDPACGSGNFLTETYLSLRRLENEALDVMQNGMMSLDFEGKIKVSIQQFYGIEINDFAVKVAKTALWIAESQMFQETKKILYSIADVSDFLPLETYENIHEANALRIDWNDVIKNTECNYIMGNPPFVGHKNVSSEQKLDMINIFKCKQGRLDFVSAWYLLAAKYIQQTDINCAFVSTNSIVQGIHLQTLWNPLIKEYKIIINFAYQTFPWTSEAKNKANVHCVIIGFSTIEKTDKYLFISSDKNGNQIMKKVTKISPYLNNSNDIIVESRSKPLCAVSKMIYGNIPRDGGFYTFETKEDVEDFLKLEPNAKKYIHKFIGSREYINGIYRYILFLDNVSPEEIKGMPYLIKKIKNVRDFRLSSKASEIRKFAQSPTKFAQTTQPIGMDFIIVPIVSSERRKYIPIGFINEDIITNNAVQIIPKATIYDFGILTSNVHMAWVRAVAGRLEMRYRYSKDIVYNNFPWPNPNEKQKEKIEKTAQMILDSRAKYPNSSLADLYDELTMPPELRKAHQQNDIAVMEAYGFDWRNMTESDCVSKLMEMYQELINQESNN